MDASNFELQAINIPDSITQIGRYTFHRCRKLQLITLPESLEADFMLFNGCRALQSRLFYCQNYDDEIVTWLHQRFTNLPLHQFFYKMTNTNTITTITLFTNLIEQLKSTLTAIDAMGMTPLHVLCANPKKIVRNCTDDL